MGKSQTFKPTIMSQIKELGRKSFFISDILESSVTADSSSDIPTSKTSTETSFEQTCTFPRNVSPKSHGAKKDELQNERDIGLQRKLDSVTNENFKGISTELMQDKTETVLNLSKNEDFGYGTNRAIPQLPIITDLVRLGGLGKPLGVPLGAVQLHPGILGSGVHYGAPGVRVTMPPRLGTGCGYAERLSQLVASQNSCLAGQTPFQGCCPTPSGPVNYTSSFYFPYGGFIPGTDSTSMRSEMMSVPIPLPVYVRSRPSPDMDGNFRAKKCRRSRTVFSELQLMGLEKRFESQKYLSTPDRVQLAKSLGLSQIQVKTWYQNRRMKWKKQVLQCGGTEPPTKPKGRPKKNSIPSSGTLEEMTSSDNVCDMTRTVAPLCNSDLNSDEESSDDISVIDIDDGGMEYIS